MTNFLGDDDRLQKCGNDEEYGRENVQYYINSEGMPDCTLQALDISDE